jgi:hypothetical protein
VFEAVGDVELDALWVRGMGVVPVIALCASVTLTGVVLAVRNVVDVTRIPGKVEAFEAD